MRTQVNKDQKDDTVAMHAKDPLTSDLSEMSRRPRNMAATPNGDVEGEKTLRMEEGRL